MKYQICPVCEGRGIVSNSFYLYPAGQEVLSSSIKPEKCRSCQGKGMLVEPEKIKEFDIDTPKKLTLEPNNFRVNSKGWKKKNCQGVTSKINPKGDIVEYVSGVSKELIGEQLFTWDAAMRETKKAGKRMPTDEEFNGLEKELLCCNVFPGYRFTDGLFYNRGTYTLPEFGLRDGQPVYQL